MQTSLGVLPVAAADPGLAQFSAGKPAGSNARHSAAAAASSATAPINVEKEKLTPLQAQVVTHLVSRNPV
jgi:hypothetical protein